MLLKTGLLLLVLWGAGVAGVYRHPLLHALLLVALLILLLALVTSRDAALRGDGPGRREP